MGPGRPSSAGTIDLSGPWRAAAGDEEQRRQFTHDDFDDDAWVELAVPGHWRSARGLEGCDGPVLHRRRFAAEAPGAGRRSFLVLEGCFYQGDVWLDGSYLGDTEGYFLPHAFEVTALLRARDEHVVAVELSCAPQQEEESRGNLTGVFQHSAWLDPGWNPGGIWRPVRLVETGPVRIAALRVRCAEATPERASLHLTARLDAVEPGEVELRTTVAPPGTAGAGVEHRHQARVTAGSNQVSWRVEVAQPTLWWPRALAPGGGPPDLVDVEVEVGVPRRASIGDATVPGSSTGWAVSDSAGRRTGLRQVRMHRWVLEVNGERLFLKGASLGPTRMALAEASVAEIEGDVALAQEAGLDLVRVRAHVARPELYEAADRAGLLVWQDLPLQRAYPRTVRHQALRQAGAAVDLLAHHPSIALWCAHDEPQGPDPLATTHRAPGVQVAASLWSEVRPSWNRTVLDSALARVLQEADGTRPVVPSSGVLPHPARGTDTHLGLGWGGGEERDLPRWMRRLPVLARFVGAFGAAAVPQSASWMEPERWPDLDWERLAATCGLQKQVFDRRASPAASPTFDAWRAASQEHQATVIRHHVEELRRLKYRPTGGFCQLLLADGHPAVSPSVLDHERVAKSGFAALRAACAPVVVVADRLAAWYRPGTPVALDVHVVSDLRHPLDGCTLRAEVTWPGGAHRWGFEGGVAADAVARVGTLSFLVPDAPGPLGLDLRLEGPASATASYGSQILPPS